MGKGPTWPSLWTQCPGLLQSLAGRQGTVTGRGFGEPAEWRGGGRGEQPGLSKGLVLTTCPATLGKQRTSLSGRQAGGLVPCGDLSNPSLPCALVAPYHQQLPYLS